MATEKANPPEFELIKNLTLALGFDGKEIPKISIHGRGDIKDDKTLYYKLPEWLRLMREPAPKGMNFAFSFERSNDAKSWTENQRIMKEDVVLGNVLSAVIRACDTRVAERPFDQEMRHLGHNSRGKTCGALNFSIVQSARGDFEWKLNAVTEALQQDPTIAQKIMQAVAIEQTMYDSVKKIEVTLNQMNNKLSSEILVEPKTEQLKNAMTEIFRVNPKDGVYRISDKEYGKLEQAVALSESIMAQGEDVAEAVFKLVKVLNSKVQDHQKGLFDTAGGVYAQCLEAEKMGGQFQLSFGGVGNQQFGRLVNNVIHSCGIETEKRSYTGEIGFSIFVSTEKDLSPAVGKLDHLHRVLAADGSPEKTALLDILKNGDAIETRMQDSSTKLRPSFDDNTGTLILYISTKNEQLKDLCKDGAKPGITMAKDDLIKAEGAAAINELMGATSELIRSMPTAKERLA